LEMAVRRPASPAQLLEINGVGETKPTRYGDTFLAVLHDHATGDGAPTAEAG